MYSNRKTSAKLDFQFVSIADKINGVINDPDKKGDLEVGDTQVSYKTDAELESSIYASPEIEMAWNLECERRWHQHLVNPTAAIPWEQVRSEIKSKFGL